MTNRSIDFMKDLDARFQDASRLTSRNFYSIFCSRIDESPVMVTGINPGGRTDGSHQLASQSFYEDGSAELADMDYRIATIMRPALLTALETNDLTVLRKVPKTNTIFQRSPTTGEFSRVELAANAKLCAPFLAEMIAFVKPKAIVLEGLGARENLVAHLATAVRTIESETVRGMRRGRMSRFFQKDIAFLNPLGREVTLLTLGHPSHFGQLPTWEGAVDALRKNLGSAFQPPQD